MKRPLTLLCLIAATACGRSSIDVFDAMDDDSALQLLPSITVPRGTFIMGSPAGEACREPWSNKETAHQVELTYDYAMLTTEVTQGQWQSVHGALPASQPSACADCPVVSVTWSEAASYCNALSESEGRAQCYSCTGTTCTAVADPLQCTGWRLPSEAEWERARRGGTSGSLYTSDIVTCGSDSALDSVAWYLGNTGAEQYVHPAAQKAANPYGLYDMAGNAWEWCGDWDQVDLGAASVIDPFGNAPTGFRCSRGGGYSDDAGTQRAAMRDSNPPASRFDYLGFRCARRL